MASDRMMPAFIFDIDGTIIDSMSHHARSWDVFLARHGRVVNDDFFRRTAGRTGVEVMRELLGPLSDADAIALVGEKEAIYRELFAPEFREIAGFRAFARSAKAGGLKLACATAGDAGNIAFALAHLGLEDFFDAVAGGHEVARGKPEPDLFLLAAHRMGVPPGACVVFEDAPLGIEGARRATMAAVAITSTIPAAELGAPAHVLVAAPDFSALDPQHIANLAAARRGSVAETQA